MMRRVLFTLATIAALGTLSGAAYADDEPPNDPPQEICIGTENQENPYCVGDPDGLTSIELPPIDELTAGSLVSKVGQLAKVGGGVRLPN